jgi:ligand-binding sensor domain-containing protein
LPTAIDQDSAGFLWAGSEAGLARWDGYRFRLYASDSKQPDGLPDHNILTLHRDSAGSLLVGTVTGGLARYELASDRFLPIPLPTSTGCCNLRVEHRRRQQWRNVGGHQHRLVPP